MTTLAVSASGPRAPEEGAGSRTWLRVTGFAPVVATYLPVARLALHRLVR
jgi:hypothetical protein